MRPSIDELEKLRINKAAENQPKAAGGMSNDECNVSPSKRVLPVVAAKMPTPPTRSDQLLPSPNENGKVNRFINNFN